VVYDGLEEKKKHLPLLQKRDSTGSAMAGAAEPDKSADVQKEAVVADVLVSSIPNPELVVVLPVSLFDNNLYLLRDSLLLHEITVP